MYLVLYNHLVDGWLVRIGNLFEYFLFSEYYYDQKTKRANISKAFQIIWNFQFLHMVILEIGLTNVKKDWNQIYINTNYKPITLSYTIRSAITHFLTFYIPKQVILFEDLDAVFVNGYVKQLLIHTFTFLGCRYNVLKF